MSTTSGVRSGLEQPATAQRRFGALFLTVAALVVGLGVGLLIGTALDGGSDSDYVVAGAGQLTDRQTLMVEVVEQYGDAWRATDGERVASFMTEDAYVEYPEEGWRFEVADGSVQDRVMNGPYASLEEFSPMMVFDDRIVLTGRVGSVSVRWLSVLHFTSTGDVKIISETLYL